MTAHSSHKKQTSMALTGFEPAIPNGRRPHTHSWDRATTGTGIRTTNHTLLWYMTIVYAFQWSEGLDFIRCNCGYTIDKGKSRFEPRPCCHCVRHVSCCPSQPGNWLPYPLSETSTPPIRLRVVVLHALRTCDFVLPGLTLNNSALGPHSGFCVDLRTNSYYFPIHH